MLSIFAPSTYPLHHRLTLSLAIYSTPYLPIHTPLDLRSNTLDLAAAFGDAPTRKALTEHFGKIRKLGKTLLSGDGTVPSTPATTTAKKTKTPATKSTVTKRKKPVISASDSEDNTSASRTKTAAKRRKHVASDSDADMKADMADLGVRIKDEPLDDNDTPSKPARRGAAAKMPKYTESDEDAEEGGHPQDADADNGSEDEYVDKEVVEKMSAYLDAPDDEDEAEV